MAQDRFSPLRTSRLALNLTQAEMADLLGTSQAQYSRWENGQSQPPSAVAVLSSWLPTLGIPPKELRRRIAEEGGHAALTKLLFAPDDQAPRKRVSHWDNASYAAYALKVFCAESLPTHYQKLCTLTNVRWAVVVHGYFQPRDAIDKLLRSLRADSEVVEEQHVHLRGNNRIYFIGTRR